MPSPIRIILTPEQEIILSETRESENFPQRTRDRAHMEPKIAQIFKCHEHTVRATLKRWQTGGIAGLSEMKGRGAKPKWQNSDLEYLSDCLENEPRTYNCKQLAHKLKQERGVDLSSDRLSRVLKKRVIGGSGLGQVIKQSKTH
jgi:transposase